MKRGAGKSKGGAFERLICKKLSLWWTEGERDDVFFRTSSSGGRATQRRKKGKRTFGQYGDVQAADPIGQPLMDMCVIECKDGYASESIADLIDKQSRHRPTYEQFISQAEQSRKAARVKWWLLIARRRGRQIMIYMNQNLWHEIKTRTSISILLHRIIIYTKGLHIVGIPFEKLLSIISPRFFIDETE